MKPEDYEDAPRFEKIPHKSARTEAKHERKNTRDLARRQKEILKQQGGR